MSDAPRPIPAEGVWSGDLADLPNWDAMPRRNRRKRRRAPYPIWLKYLVVSLVLAVVVSLAQIALHAYRADPRDARVFAERELRLTLLRPNERVLASDPACDRAVAAVILDVTRRSLCGTLASVVIDMFA